MFSQFFVQIFALYKFFRKNLRKKRRKFSMDPICLLLLLMTSLGSELESNSSTLAALQIGCLRPPLPLFDLGR